MNEPPTPESGAPAVATPRAWPTAAAAVRWAPAVVALAAGLAFVTSLRGDLVADDLVFLPGNPRLAALRSVSELFGGRLRDFAIGDHQLPLYRPGFVAVLWAGDVLAGFRAAWQWHLVAVLIHVANACLVLALLRRLAPSAPGAALAGALLFAVHPVHAEAVSWVISAGHTIAAALVLSAAVLLVPRGGQAGPGRIAGAALLAGAAMVTSEAMLAAPALLVALDLHRAGRLRVATVGSQALITAGVLLARASVLGTVAPLSVSWASLRTAAEFGIVYLRHLVWPFPQLPWLAPPSSSIVDATSCAIAAAAIAGAAWLARRAWRSPEDRGLALLGLAWTALASAPAVAAATSSSPLFAPRALYLAPAGLALLATWAAKRPWSGTVRAAAAAAAIAGVAACNVAALGWRDAATVYARALRATPQHAPLHAGMATLASARGDAAGAELHLRTAVSFARGPVQLREMRERLAQALLGAGKLDEAEATLLEVTAADPRAATAWVGLGNVSWTRGDRFAARDRYLEAARLDPSLYPAVYDAALALEATGDPERAAVYRARAARLDPSRAASPAR